jgi:flagellar motor switch protein FliG
VLLLSIEREAAAAILRRLPEARVEEISRAMKELREVPVDRQAVDEVLQEFARRAAACRTPLGDVDAQAEEVLRHALGAERAAAVAERVERQVLSRKPFRSFENVDPQDLAAVLEDEHPQVAAVILAHLDPPKAGRVLAHVADRRRVDLVRRIASLERTSVEVVQRVVQEVGRRIEDLGLGTVRGEPQSWVETAAQIVNALGGGELEVLEGIEADDPQLAERIRTEMFSFEDLAALDRRSMQRLLSDVDSRSLALALKAASPAVEQNVFRNLSRRATAMLLEERDEFGPTPLSEVLAAQQQVLAALRAAIERGEVRLGDPEEELV